MDVASILNELWHRRWWAVVGVVLAAVVAASVVVQLPSLKSKASVVGVATVDVLVDASQSSLASINSDVGALGTRASIYARMIGSTEVKNRIAKIAGIAPERVAYAALTTATGDAATAVPAPGTYVLSASSEDAYPVVHVAVQGPSAADAVRLADATTTGLAGYVRELQVGTDIRPKDRVHISGLGPARGGLSRVEASYTNAALAFIFVFLAWCVLVLVTSRVVAGLREVRAAEKRDELAVLWSLRSPDDEDVEETPARRRLS